MTIDEVIDKVAEGHTWHEEEHTCAEGNDRGGGEGEVFKPIVGEIYESHAGNNGCHDTSYDSDGAIVDFPALQTLFDKETTEGGEENNADGGPISLKQAAESGIGSSSKEEYDPIVETRYLFYLLQFFICLSEGDIFCEDFVGKTAQSGDGVKVDASVCEGGDAGVGVFSIFVPKGEEHVGRHNGEDGFYVPCFCHLLDFALNAHGGGSARKERACVVAEEFGDVFELIVHFVVCDHGCVYSNIRIH